MSGAMSEWREKLMEGVAETSDALLEKYLGDGELSGEDFGEGLRRGIAEAKVVPVFCGSAVQNLGPHGLIEGARVMFPSPADRGPVTGRKPGAEDSEERSPSADAPLSALAFKTIAEAHVGDLTVFRVFSGKMI